VAVSASDRFCTQLSNDGIVFREAPPAGESRGKAAAPAPPPASAAAVAAAAALAAAEAELEVLERETSMAVVRRTAAVVAAAAAAGSARTLLFSDDTPAGVRALYDFILNQQFRPAKQCVFFIFFAVLFYGEERLTSPQPAH
jgi:hypothetical protein